MMMSRVGIAPQQLKHDGSYNHDARPPSYYRRCHPERTLGDRILVFFIYTIAVARSGLFAIEPQSAISGRWALHVHCLCIGTDSCCEFISISPLPVRGWTSCPRLKIARTGASCNYHERKETAASPRRPQWGVFLHTANGSALYHG